MITTEDYEVLKKRAIEKDIVARKMSPQQIAQAQELARNWKPKKK